MNGTLAGDPLFTRLLRLVTLALLAMVAGAAIASAQYCTCDECDECDLNACNGNCCYESPELWIVNTRCAPKCSNLDEGFKCITFQRYDCKCCRFVNESAESFLAQNAAMPMPTMIFMHGNTLKHKGAMKQCQEVYAKMRCCPGKKRLVYWSWPAQRVYKMKGLKFKEMVMKNLRIKYVYSDYQGYYVAKLVQQMDLSQRVMIAGHSYGGIISASALHFLGGGTLKGLTLEGGRPEQRDNLRGGLISGAFDFDMLESGKRYGQAFVSAEKIYVTRNIKDSTLKNWHKVSWRCCPAIGKIGVNANRLGEYRHKLCQQTMTIDVGKSHYLNPHLKSVRFVRALCCLSFPECQNCPSTAATAEPIEDELVSTVIPRAAEESHLQ
jgi:hypothetical protein